MVRFAPSPTGSLHIGGARTALYNYLFAKHHNGDFLLRIEDTDQERSTPEAVDAILSGLKWLGLSWNGNVVYQSQRKDRHQEVARALYDAGEAYYCTCSPQHLQKMREESKACGKKPGYDGRCRKEGHKEGALRLLTADEGFLSLEDLVQGQVQVRNDQIDDMILLRSDGTPTYLLSVVVDDHDMGITHVIRGDDHLTNTFRQLQIYKAAGWEPPLFAHIPLIHGPDGAKLSKRHGATSVGSYREMGYLPSALRNYLLRLGWGHGDEEIISDEKAIEWFSLDHVGRSASRFDFKKLDNLNAHYLRHQDNESLLQELGAFFPPGQAVDPHSQARILRGLDGLKIRATNLRELAENAQVYRGEGLPLLGEAARKIMTPEAADLVKGLMPALASLEEWEQSALENLIRLHAQSKGVKLGELAQILRVAFTGKTISPSLFEMMEIWGKEESLKRLAPESWTTRFQVT